MAYHLASHDARPADREPGGVEAAPAFESVVGQSREIREVIAFARKVAMRRSPTVLLMGETGTGKELFARGIHYAGPDPEAPFVAVNCPAIPASLLESELFGHEKGAFTDARDRKRGLLELAEYGTLFLDEVAELPPDLQPKLLRALEERRVRRIGGTEEVEIRCRIVAASNRPLEEAVEEGTFREDLFYRLNVVRIRIPPLRERAGDLEVLSRHFLDELSREQGVPARSLTPEALETLRRHRWPGNVRELKNVIQRAALLADGARIRARDVVIHEREPRRPGLTPDEARSEEESGLAIEIPPEGRPLDEIEAEAFRITLSITGGNKSAAARILGVSRPTVDRKIERYDLDRPNREEEGEGR